MNTQLEIAQQEMKFLQQQNELLLVRQELQKLQAQKVSRLEDSIYSPSLYPHYKMVAKDMAESSLVPKAYIGKPNDILVAIAMGYQLGLPVEQALQHIAVVNGKPSLYGDGMLALIIGRPDCTDVIENPIIENNTIIGYLCTVKRRGKSDHTQPFTLNDAKKANLLGKGGAWQSNPSRMLQLRARAFALRDRFPDVLSGIPMYEEQQDYIDGEVVQNNFTQNKNLSQVDRVKQSYQSRKGLNNDNQTSAKPIESVVSDSIEAENSVDSQTAEKNAHDSAMADAGKQKNTVDDSSNSTQLLTKDQLSKITCLLYDKEGEGLFPAERLESALHYFEVDCIESMSEEQAERFITMLNKVK